MATSEIAILPQTSMNTAVRRLPAISRRSDGGWQYLLDLEGHMDEAVAANGLDVLENRARFFGAVGFSFTPIAGQIGYP